MAEIKFKRITNANVYLDGKGLLGQVEECNLPEVKYKDADHKALGMFGMAAFTSGIDKMETKLKWNSFYGDSLVKVANPLKFVKIQVRGHVENWDSSGNSSNEKLVAYMRVAPANFPGAAFKAQDNVEIESSLKVYYYKLTVGGVDVIEVDVMANIFKVNGVDLLTEYRANIGG